MLKLSMNKKYSIYIYVYLSIITYNNYEEVFEQLYISVIKI